MPTTNVIIRSAQQERLCAWATWSEYKAVNGTPRRVSLHARNEHWVRIAISEGVDVQAATRSRTDEMKAVRREGARQSAGGRLHQARAGREFSTWQINWYVHKVATLTSSSGVWCAAASNATRKRPLVPAPAVSSRCVC